MKISDRKQKNSYLPSVSFFGDWEVFSSALLSEIAAGHVAAFRSWELREEDGPLCSGCFFDIYTGTHSWSHTELIEDHSVTYAGSTYKIATISDGLEALGLR